MNTRLRRERPRTANRRQQWSAAVFKRYGRVCWLHRRRDPKSKVAAQDPAHILKRSTMGSPIAYGPKDGPVEPRLGRPLCRSCHDRQEDDLDRAYRFSYDDVLEATLTHNAYAKQKLPLPEKEHYPE